MKRKVPPFMDLIVPESSKIPSPAAMRASKMSFTDGNSGRIWFLENPKVSNWSKEKYFPRLEEDDNPIFITPWLAREWVAKEFIKNDKKLGKSLDSSWWSSFQNRSFSISASLNLVDNILLKGGEKRVVVNPLSTETTLRAGYASGDKIASVCLAGSQTKGIMLGEGTYRIPSCMNKEWYPKLDILDLRETNIKTVTGMNKMNVREILFPLSTEVIDPEGLPKELKVASISGSKMRELRGLEKTSIEKLDASGSKIQFISPGGLPDTLESIKLDYSDIRTIGGMRNTKIDTIETEGNQNLSLIDPSGLPPGLTLLKVNLSPSIEKIPDLDKMPFLKQMDFSENPKLREMGKIPSNLRTLDISGTAISNIDVLKGTSSLHEIYATDCKKLKKIDPASIPFGLKKMWLSGSGIASKGKSKGKKGTAKQQATSGTTDCEELKKLTLAEVICD